MNSVLRLAIISGTAAVILTSSQVIIERQKNQEKVPEGLILVLQSHNEGALASLGKTPTEESAQDLGHLIGLGNVKVIRNYRVLIISDVCQRSNKLNGHW